MAGGLLYDEQRLLFVANRRRNGHIDWSPPGGVVDAGETPLEALTREVQEETGLRVAHWSRLCWTTEVHFVDLEMHLAVEVHLADTIEGVITVDDPDGIVIEAEFLEGSLIDERLMTSPAWVAEPIREWIKSPWSEARHFAYRATGSSSGSMTAERLD